MCLRFGASLGSPAPSDRAEPALPRLRQIDCGSEHFEAHMSAIAQAPNTMCPASTGFPHSPRRGQATLSTRRINRGALVRRPGIALGARARARGQPLRRAPHRSRTRSWTSYWASGTFEPTGGSPGQPRAAGAGRWRRASWSRAGRSSSVASTTSVRHRPCQRGQRSVPRMDG